MAFERTARPGCLAVAVSVAAVLCTLVQPPYTAALPAPPTDVPALQAALLDGDISSAGRAAPSPITEEELHQMIEDLLMEAYGDEYEPPASPFKTKSLALSKTLPVPKPKRPPSKPKSSDIQSKSSLVSPFLPEADILSTILSPRPQSSRSLAPQPTIVPISKPNTPQQEIRQGPPQLVSLIQNAPKLNTNLSPTPTRVQQALPQQVSRRPAKPTAKISKLSSGVMSTSVPVAIAQTLTPSELMGAVLVEQDDQPNILIVDRRTKNKEAKVLNAGRTLSDFQRNSRSPSISNAPRAAPALVPEQSAPAAASVATDGPAIVAPQIRPATLLSHIKSEGNKPFKSVDSSTRRTVTQTVTNNPSTTDSNVIQLSPAPVATPQASTLSVEAPASTPQTPALPDKTQNAGKSFSDDDAFDSPNAFTLPNLEPVRNPSLSPVLDVDDIDDEDLLLLELLGSRMNKAGFGAEQSITPAVRLGSSLNLGPQTETQKSSTRQQNGNAIDLSSTGQSRASQVPGIFSDEDKIVIDLATIGGGGTPLPLLTGSSNSQGNFLSGKEIGTENDQQSLSSSNRPSPSLVSSLDTPIDSRMTVGDLIRSLDGLNGIQVLSLSDLRNQQESEAAPSTGTTISEHLRATMLSRTRETGSQGVGVPLPSVEVSNSIAAQGAVQIASENPGRQFDQTTGFESDTSFDNFFDESTGTSGKADVGIALSDVAGNAGSAATSGDSFSTTVDDTNGFPLEENSDFDFEEYEDDLDDLPPQPESVFRRGISDIFFTKGQWLGTLLGGVIDIGSSIGESVSKLFNKSGSSSSS